MSNRIPVQLSSEAEKLKNGYDLAHQAFEQVHGRVAKLTPADSGWIRGWQSGYARRCASTVS